MKREAPTYGEALRAFRAVTAQPADDTAAARARVLAAAGRGRTRAPAWRLSFFVALPLFAVASVSIAWTAAGRWRAEKPRTIPAEVGEAPEVGGAGERRRDVRVIPVVVEAAPAVVTDAEGERAAYARAHRAHFVEDAPARALVEWDAYLRSFPSGPFAPEAGYNRALCLARLGRFAQATAALRPYARGRYGAYRQEEATRLLEWLATRSAR